ncbi:hypothetical protein NIES593_22685 [Hydrococcus rivularis NIES-593]|uniref:Uncharacterized protein n=2 Tax=Cyanophyceae TaxID=3028117 RepID=A0A1U7H728_9CYAN|nr:MULTISPECIES: hypothetical protein [Cyanophyceae]OKH10820.1 hypothetical protein NIES592_23880 [Fischerella major NIES-592]OKH17830.1 hypothetical protein NIES593_22685 [Hydrococcus rivularis NIES-593]
MVKKLNVKVTAEQMAIAHENGIHTNTVYARLKNGWELTKAITEPPKKLPQLAKLKRNEEGSLIAEQPKGRLRSLRLDQDLDDAVDKAIAESGLTMADWFSEIVRKNISSKKRKTA